MPVQSRSSGGPLGGRSTDTDSRLSTKFGPACFSSGRHRCRELQRLGRRADAGPVRANWVSARLHMRGRKTVDTLKQVLTRLQADGSALGHFNVSDLVMLKAVVAGAVQFGTPVMVGASEGEREFVGVSQLA